MALLVMRGLQALLGILALVTAGACFSPNYGSAGFSCGASGDCPSGYECQSDGICHRDGTGGDRPDASPSATDADPNAPDASATDAAPNPGPDAALQANTCSNPGVLVEGVDVPGTIIGAGDELGLSCSTIGGNDAVHELSIAATRDILVAVNPQSDWDLHASLRTKAGCESSSDIACVPGAFGTRYLNIANQAMGSYDVVVDGATDGNYSIRYETREVDTGFGYWQQRSTASYVPLSGPAVQSIPINNDFDEEVLAVALPFTFPFFGTGRTAINIHTNGFASFDVLQIGLSTTNYINDCSFDTTTPFNMIAPFWDDLYPAYGGGAASSLSASTIKHELQGTAPYRRFVIEWGNWRVVQSDDCSGAGCLIQNVGIHHQAVLHESGDIEFRYGPRTAPPTINGCATPHLGCSATIGLRNSDGTDNDEAGCNGANLIADGAAIYFVHPN